MSASPNASGQAPRRGFYLAASAMECDFQVVDPKATMLTVAGLMNDKGKDVVLVLGEKGAPVGMVEGRDLVRLASRGENLGTIRVEDAMSSPVPVIGPDAPVMLALELVGKGAARAIVVVDSEGSAMGVLDLPRLLGSVMRELRELHGELLRLDELKSDFVKSVSHELRTPLAAIDGSISNIMDGIYGPAPEELSPYLAMIERNAKRLGKVIGDLLTISEMEGGRYLPIRESVDLRSVAEDALNTFRRASETRGIRLINDVPEGLEVQADRAMLVLLFSHLVSNGVRFSADGGEVRVSAEDREEYVKGCVADKGRGIPAQDIERVFEKFHQVGREDGPGERGTGLGLAICKHVLEKHQGRIWVESEVGRGSRFFFILPKTGV